MPSIPGLKTYCCFLATVRRAPFTRPAAVPPPPPQATVIRRPISARLGAASSTEPEPRDALGQESSRLSWHGGAPLPSLPSPRVHCPQLREQIFETPARRPAVRHVIGLWLCFHTLTAHIVSSWLRYCRLRYDQYPMMIRCSVMKYQLQIHEKEAIRRRAVHLNMHNRDANIIKSQGAVPPAGTADNLPRRRSTCIVST